METVLSPESIIEHMLEGEDKWDKISQLITDIVKVKEKDEIESNKIKPTDKQRQRQIYERYLRK